MALRCAGIKVQFFNQLPNVYFLPNAQYTSLCPHNAKPMLPAGLVGLVVVIAYHFSLGCNLPSLIINCFSILSNVVIFVLSTFEKT